MSDAALVVQIVGEERLSSKSSTDFSTFYVMSSDATIDEVIDGDFEPGDTVAVSRMVTGETLDSALAESACTVGAEQAWTAGSRYLVGLSRDDRGWFPTAGPASVIPFNGTGNEAFVEISCPPIPGSNCSQFPYDLDGASYRSILREARA